MKQSEPLKTGFLVTEIDGVPYDLPVKLIFPNGSLTKTQSNELRVAILNSADLFSLGDDRYLKLNQSTSQTVINGTPQFDEGIVIHEDEWLYLDGV